MTDTTETQIQSLGGKARAKKLSKGDRSAIAKGAAEARWEKAGNRERLPVATHGSPDHPLCIGDLEIPCYVLDNGMRVLSMGGTLKALGLSLGSAGASTRSGVRSGDGTNRLMRFVDGKRLAPFISAGLKLRMTNPIRFKSQFGGPNDAQGYEATILPDLCDAVLAARQAKALLHQQEDVAARCEILVRGFARVGIIALVDEATGFQYDRPRRDLEEYLKKFLSENLRRWVRTFPADYFKHLCRLRGVELRPDMKLPQYFGVLTNNLIYRRIAPRLLNKLKERRAERGNQSNKLHSWLSEDIGVREVLVHLGIVIGLMKIHTVYEAFEVQLDQVAPIYPENPGLFDNPKDWGEDA
jgi:hypothetical protein